MIFNHFAIAMSQHTRKILIPLVIAFFVFYAWRYGQQNQPSGGSPATPPAYQEQPSCPGTALASREIAERLGETSKETPVYGQGEVVKVLPDDTKGIQHQRFLLKVAPGLVVLVAHNIDMAERINGLAAGDRLSFCGEYIWNDKGGVLHWTHHESRGKHPGGWLSLNNRLYR